MDTLRVLTLNCWNLCEPLDQRMALIRAGIAALQPDVIGLQEIIVRADGFDQGALIMQDLGYEWVYGAAMRWDEQHTLLPWDAEGNAFGNLVASRWPISRSAVRQLPGSETHELRSVLATVIEAPCGPLALLTTHLNWKYHHGNVRERQVVALADFAAEWQGDISLPPLIIGDLNADPDSAEIRFLCGLQSLEGRSTFFQDAWRVAGDGSPGFTWDNCNSFAHLVYEPDRRIDYILVGLADSQGRGWIESARVVMNEARDGVFPSDHFGVLAEIRV